MSFPRYAARATSFVAALAAIAVDPGAAQDAPAVFRHDARLSLTLTPVVRPLLSEPVPSPAIQLRDTDRVPDPGIGPPLAGAVAGAMLGLYVGGCVGMQLDTGFRGTCEGEAGLGTLIGLTLAPAITIPLGAHLADGRRGSLRHAMAGSLAVAALALPTGLYSDVGMMVIALAPLGELFISVAAEVASRPK